MRILLLLISVLLPSSAWAETAEEQRPLYCFAVMGALFFSNDLSDHALGGPGELTVSETKTEGILIENAAGAIGYFTLSPEQKKEHTVTDLMDECKKKLGVLLNRKDAPMEAFADGKGLICSKSDQSIMLSDSAGAGDVPLSVVTGFSKKEPGVLTVLIGTKGHSLILSSTQAKLPLDRLMAACEFKADERQSPMKAATG